MERSNHGRWGGRSHDAEASVYGRRRTVRYQERPCRWSVTGPGEPVRAFVFAVDGYGELWFLVTTSATLTAAQVAEVFARFRQGDGFRDHKPRPGMEERRAWTKAPVEGGAAPVVAQTRLPLLGRRLDAAARAGGCNRSRSGIGGSGTRGCSTCGGWCGPPGGCFRTSSGAG